MESLDKFKLPGEHVYDGITFSYSVTEESLNATRNLELEDGDVIIATYPKSGTTFTQEITWLIMNNVDIEAANNQHLFLRSAYLELDARPDIPMGTDVFKTVPRPRLGKTHLPWHMAPKDIEEKGIKVIHVLRNPKDALVSLYHFYRSTKTFGYFKGTWDDFFQLFLKDKLWSGNIFDHAISWWKQRERENLLVLKYEDMLKDHRGNIKKIAEFLGKNLTENEIDKIEKHTKFNAMKANKMTNYSGAKPINQEISPFMRKGIVGDWKNHFSDEQNKIMDQLIAERLAETDLSFDYE